MPDTCTLAVQPNMMKPLPELPPPNSMEYVPTSAARDPLLLTYPPKSTDHGSPNTIMPGSAMDRLQRLCTLRGQPADEALSFYPFEPDHINIHLNNLLTPPPPTRHATQPKQPQHPPPRSAISHLRPFNEVTYPRVPQRSTTDGYILISHDARHLIGEHTYQSQAWHKSNHGHQFDQLSTIETRLDAWIQENQHHAEPSPDEDTHELRCDKCRFGIGLIDVQKPNVTSKTGLQWTSPRQGQMKKSTRMQMRSCTMPAAQARGMGTLITVKEVGEGGSGSESEMGSDGEDTANCVMLQQMQERKSTWDKPSFKALLLRVGGLKGK